MMNSTAIKLVLLLLLPILVTTWRFRRKYIYSNHSRFYVHLHFSSEDAAQQDCHSETVPQVKPQAEEVNREAS